MAERIKFDVKLEGLEGIKRAIADLPKELQGRPIRNSLMSGAKPIRDHARAIHTWQDDTGFLREAIVSYPVKKNEHEYTDQVRVGVLRRRKKRESKRLRASRGRRQVRQNKKIVTPYYWHYLEFGTSRMAAKPWLRPAFEAEKSGSAKRIVDQMRVEVDKAAKKVSSK